MDTGSDVGLFALIAFSLTVAALLIARYAHDEMAGPLTLLFSVALSALYASGVVVLLRARARRRRP